MHIQFVSAMMNTCKFFQKNISAIFDGELTEQESHNTLAHIKNCPACAAFYSRCKKVQGAIEQLEEIKAPENVSHLLFRRIAADKNRKKPPLLAKKPALKNPLWVYATAAAIVSAVITIFAVRFSETNHIADDTEAEKTQFVQQPVTPARAEMSISAEKTFLLQSYQLLLQTANTGQTDHEFERKTATELLQRYNSIQDHFSRTKSRIEPLLQEIEPFLYEVANLESKQDLDFIQKELQQNSLLTKLKFAQYIEE